MSENDRAEPDTPRKLGAAPQALAWAGVAWLFVAFVLFWQGFRSHNFVQWLLARFTPVWAMDMQGEWQRVPWEIVGQGMLLFWTILVAVGLGRRLHTRVFSIRPRFEEAVWGTGLALGIGATVVFLLGILGCIGHARIVFGGILVVLTGWVVWIQVKRGPTALPLRVPHFSPLEWALLCLMAVVQGLALLYALTPATQSDALRYHLAAPQEWLKAGRLIYLPLNAHSNFPSTVEMLFLYGLGLGGDLLAKALHWVFLPLTTGAVALLVSEMVPRRDAGDAAPRRFLVRPSVLAAAVWGTLPLPVAIAGWAFVDLAVLFFTLGTVFFLLRWLRTGLTRNWVVAGIFGGFLVASKYTGVLTVVWGAVLMTLAEWCGLVGRSVDSPSRRSFWRPLATATAYGLIAAAIASPWWIKNVVHTGNPFYPLACSVFGGDEWTETCQDIYTEKIGEKGFGRGPLELVRLPWDTAIHTRTFGGFDIGPFYWALYPWIVGWCALAVWRFRARPRRALLALWLLFFLLSWFWTYQDNRFLLPVLALGAVIAGASVWPVFRAGSPLLRWACAIGVALPLLYGALSASFWLVLDEGKITDRLGVRWPAVTMGFLSRDDYLSDPTMRVPYYPAARYANGMLGPEAKVLFIGEHRKMHWHCRVASNDWYDQPMIRAYLEGATDADAVLDAIRADGFTHVFLNLAEWGWPEDPRQQTGEKPIPPGAAWNYNRRHFTREEILLLGEVLQSKRLRPEMVVLPGKVYLAMVAPRSL